MQDDALAPLLARIAEALERLAPPAPVAPDFSEAEGFVFHPRRGLVPVRGISRVPLDFLVGIERVRDILLENTRRFAAGHGANNALLWGSRGMGKSSLVKAVHAEVNAHTGGGMKLVEIAREDLPHLGDLMDVLRGAEEQRFILFCDDLSFDVGDEAYKSLKTALEGGLSGRPKNVIFYATSNRRHLLPRDMIENERATAITPGEAVEEKVSLSDRFGLWLGFHKCDQDAYLAMVEGYLSAAGLAEADPETVRHEALEWATTRGSRSGRVALQFAQDYAGRHGRALVFEPAA